MSSKPETGYAELHCVSNYSFLRGASHPEELVYQAARLGYRAIAITDECSMAGMVKAHMAAKQAGIHLITGSEFHLDDADGKDIHLVLLAPDREAYGQICHLITLGRRRADKGEYRLDDRDLARGLDACLAIWYPASSEQDDPVLRQGQKMKSLFPQRLWIGLEAFLDGEEVYRYRRAFRLRDQLQIPLLASGDVHMHIPDRKPLQDVLSAIRMGQSVRLAGRLLQSNREKHLRPVTILEKLFPPALLTETLRIAERCHFNMDTLRYEYPEELVPPHLTPAAYLRQRVEAGAEKRWPEGPAPETLALIEKELTLIEELSYEYYFLTVFDVVHFARSQGILCQGRGSAANSVVCYCLEITEVNPQQISLLFERFISKERDEPPDIDVDFEHERREEVIQYLYKKYGRHRAALAATVITYRPKSAIRDVGKALGMDLQLVDHLAKSLSWWDKKEELLARFEAAGVDVRSPVIGQFVSLVNQILGFPRHLSQHVGGFVISRGPLSHLVPVENAAMAERTIIQWDKDDLESLGLLKIDVLALGMLTAIRKSLAMISQYRQRPMTLADIPVEDPLTYQMLQRGDSVGVFQVESRAQISMLPRLKPKNFYDLVIEVAIVRPGPIQGKMVHPYLKRRNGLEPVTYANEAVREVLGRTLGIPIFQEQVIKLAMVAAGFTAGEADQLRRAMAAWKRRGGLAHFEEKLINGMLERGHDRAFAERIFEQIKGFGDYGFPESHAASFALLVYVSAWLKCHEPAAFYAGLLNSQPMGFYSPSQLIQDARRHGVEIRPVDVLYSDWESTLEPPGLGMDRVAEPASQSYHLSARQPALRLGLQRIKGLKREAAGRILHLRQQAEPGKPPFANLEDLARRVGLGQDSLVRLTEGGALKSLAGHRFQTHWQVQGILPASPLVPGNHTYAGASESGIQLPAPTEIEDLSADYAALGLTLGRHPMAIIREKELWEKGGPFHRCKKAADLELLPHGRFVRVAGIVTGRQRPASASGVIFLTLEDETNNINVVIWTRVLERFRAAVVQGSLLKIKGVLEREASVIHVIAGHIEDLSHYLTPLLTTKSRDFR